jgi:hypothetical protein
MHGTSKVKVSQKNEWMRKWIKERNKEKKEKYDKEKKYEYA